MYPYRIDPQDAVPLGFCIDCGREIYDPGAGGYCADCAGRREDAMSMKALAAEYRRSAELLGERIDALGLELKMAEGGQVDKLNRRRAALCAMYRETMQTARVLERYD